jgi:hypothetical protein
MRGTTIRMTFQRPMTARRSHRPLPARLAIYPIDSYGYSSQRFCERAGRFRRPGRGWKSTAGTGESMSRLFLIVGLIALVIGLLWIGQGTGAIDWPRSSFMIRQIQWAGYGAALAALGLILIWQSKR